MNKIYNCLEEMIGSTPMLSLSKLENVLNWQGHVFAKIESFNPGGSIKDRTAYNMITDAEKRNILKEGGTVIEPTSGNTGIGLCAICASRGYHAIIVMPDSMSIERVKLMRAYGAEVVLTPGDEGMNGAVKMAEELHRQNANSIIAGQFSNPANRDTHYYYTGPEIWENMNGKVDIFVAGIGTGGTISGTGRYLKEKQPDIQIIGVEPFDSPLISKGYSGGHKLQGIGANFIPEVYDPHYVDNVLTATTEEAYNFCRIMAREFGLLVGISSGAALSIASSLAENIDNHDKNIIVILPDSGERYLSTDLFNYEVNV